MRRTRSKTAIQLAVSAIVALTMMGAFFAVGGLTGGHNQIVLAKGKGGTRPGWGCGDTNHTHTGPPGLASKSATSPCKMSSTTTVSTSSVGSSTSSASSTTSTSSTSSTAAGVVGGAGTHAKTHNSKTHHSKKNKTKKNKTKKTHTAKSKTKK